MVSISISRFAALALAVSTLFPCFAQQQAAKDSAQKDNSSNVVTPLLRGLVFIPDSSKLRARGIDTAGIITTGIGVLNRPSFHESMASYLGKPLTFAGLHRITSFVVGYYRSHHHPLVNVVVPEQNVEGGVVQIVVTEYRVGSVHVTGNRWFSSSAIAAPFTLRPGDTINSTRILSDLDEANANPFRRVNLIYKPDQRSGYTDLVLQTEDRLPLRFYTGFDNSGTAATGHNRWNAGVVWGNVFGLDQQLSYRFSSSSDLYQGSSRFPGAPGGPAFISHTLTWSTPLAVGGTLSIFGDYERTVPNIGPDLGLVGLNGQASIRYNHSLPRTARFAESIQTGYDFKTTDNDLAFGGTSVFATSAEIDQFPVSYSANLTDDWGITSSSTTLVYSPGSLTPDNTAAEFQNASAGYGPGLASNRYLYLREDLSRLTRLPLGAAWSARIVAQISNASLLYTEQLVAGGPELLRGYPTNSILGDEGVIVSNELRTPPFLKGMKRSVGRVQFLGFWDYGSLHAHQATAGYDSNVDASSIGVGMRYRFRRTVSAKFDYGWQLRSLPGIPGGGHLANIALVVGN